MYTPGGGEWWWWWWWLVVVWWWLGGGGHRLTATGVWSCKAHRKRERGGGGGGGRWRGGMGGAHTKRQVFHYRQIYKNSLQYLKMMESQLLERHGRAGCACARAWCTAPSARVSSRRWRCPPPPRRPARRGAAFLVRVRVCAAPRTAGRPR